ncbi:MAG: HlyD family efflux transporter periplasmic adaptor subunit [Limnothrix sp. RL_2_0]|nr:HlyD family efflux transporter periplasmic adaptor subunit [Limnothrix sp. RL_2_0]
MTQSPPIDPKQTQNIDNNGSNATFDQPVVLRQSPTLSRAVIWVILIFTGSFCTWAYFARIEQVVTGTGQLQPKGAVKEIQAPVNGVVEAVFVEDGDRVTQGQRLLTFDSDAAEANRVSLLEIKASLLQENQLYREVIKDQADIQTLQSQIDKMNLAPEVAALARNRLSLVSEAQVLRAQLGESRVSLNSSQTSRLSASRREYASRVATAELESQQLQQLIGQNTLQLADLRAQLATDRQVLKEIRIRNKESKNQAEESLKIESDILDAIRPLVEDGAVARLQMERQQQQVNDRTERMIEQQANGSIELEQQQQRVDSRITEIDQILKEQKRVQLDLRQAQAERLNIISLVERTLREQLDNVQQRLAAVDSELNKVIVENTKRLSEIDGQLIQTEETLEYQEVRSPINGTVFDLQAGPGFVPRGQAEPLLKIVPNDDLIAEVFITNRDIGFVQQRFNEALEDGKALETAVRIDTYAFNQYGDIEGEIIHIGSDALPPDEIYPYYRFPIRVVLDEQSLRGRPLQSGMSVSVNIKIRENRRVYTLFTDLFSRRVDDLKRTR